MESHRGINGAEDKYDQAENWRQTDGGGISRRAI